MESPAVTYLLLAFALAVALFIVLLVLDRRRLRTERDVLVAESVACRSEWDETNAELQTLRARLDTLGEAALDALLLLDSHRRLVWSNENARALFDEPGEVTGRSFISYVNDAELNQTLLDALSGNRSMVRQVAIDGRTLRMHAVPVGEGMGAAVAIEDVSELQRLGRARRELVANISHEVRTPLANIDLAAQTLRGAGAGDGRVPPELLERMLALIEEQVRTLSQLSQEMIELSQIESGQVLLRLVEQPVSEVVAKAVTAFRPQAASKRQQLNVEIPDGLRALVDEEQLARALGNILHNAVKFTPEGGTITVSATETGEDDVELCVTDTGPGVPDPEKERIFERFYKQDRARTRGGTGLGLAIARHIVEGHGGRIWVESTPGAGARFRFTVPRG